MWRLPSHSAGLHRTAITQDSLQICWRPCYRTPQRTVHSRIRYPALPKPRNKDTTITSMKSPPKSTQNSFAALSTQIISLMTAYRGGNSAIISRTISASIRLQNRTAWRYYTSARPRRPRVSRWWGRAVMITKGLFEAIKAYFYPVLGITSVAAVLTGWYMLSKGGKLRQTLDAHQRTIVFRGVQTGRTPPEDRFYRRHEAKALARAMDTLASDEMLLVVGPSGIGKSSLIEEVLEDDTKYEVCHIKMKGKSVTIDDAINGVKEQFGFGWTDDLAGMKVKAGLLSLEKKNEDEEDHPTIAAVLSQVESRIINTPPQNNRIRVIFVDDVTELRYLIQGKYFSDPIDKFIIVKSFLKWLSDMGPHCKVVLASSDGFTYRLLSSAGIMTNVRYHEVRDLPEHQARLAMMQFLGGESMYHQVFGYGHVPPNKHFEGESPSGPKDLSWDEVYRVLGGRISQLKRWSNSPTNEVLETMKVEMRGWVEEMMGQTVPRLEDREPPLFGPKALEFVFTALVEDGRTAGDTQKHRGVKLRKLCEAGIPLHILESMSQYGIVTLNHRQRRVTLPSRLMLAVLSENPQLWINPELRLMVRIEGEEDTEHEIHAHVSTVSKLKESIANAVCHKHGWHLRKQKVKEMCRLNENDGLWVSVIDDDRQLLQLKNGDVLRVNLSYK